MSPKPTPTDASPDRLERIFHSPARMAILSALCAADRSGLTFTELREACDLTDGNLNGHLTALIEEEVIRIKKEFVGLRPRSTVFLTRTGLERFSQYLDALTQALESARSALPAVSRRASAPAGARAARA